MITTSAEGGGGGGCGGEGGDGGGISEGGECGKYLDGQPCHLSSLHNSSLGPALPPIWLTKGGEGEHIHGLITITHTYMPLYQAPGHHLVTLRCVYP